MPICDFDLDWDRKLLSSFCVGCAWVLESALTNGTVAVFEDVGFTVPCFKEECTVVFWFVDDALVDVAVFKDSAATHKSDLTFLEIFYFFFVSGLLKTRLISSWAGSSSGGISGISSAPKYEYGLKRFCFSLLFCLAIIFETFWGSYQSSALLDERELSEL